MREPWCGWPPLAHSDTASSVPERIEELLRDILREEAAAKVSIDAIQKTVAEYFDIRLADMTSRRRPANIAFPRQIAMYLSRKLTGGSLVEIGDAFGGPGSRNSDPCLQKSGTGHAN